MRRLVSGLLLVLVLGQIPQVSASFQEEEQGIEAVYGKVVKAYEETVAVYNETRQEAEVIQGRLAKTKEDLDRNMPQVSVVYSKALTGLKSFTESAKNVLKVSKTAVNTGEDDTGASLVSEK